MAKYAANYGPLTPITFLERTAALHPERTSIIYGDLRWTWAQTMERCRRLASRISQLVSVGQTVSVLSPNSPAVYEMNFGVPMARAVLNSINSRLDARTIAVLLNHSETKVLFVDSQYLQVVQEALRIWIESSPDSVKPEIILIEDRLDAGRISFKTFLPGWGELVEYEELLQSGDPAFPIQWPLDDWETISLNYTSGTTSRPKGVLYHHRGAYLCPLITVQAWGMEDESVYLWTLPMFHCNGWCFVWGMAAVAGTNVIMRNVETKAIYDLIVKHKVTHLCGAPVVLNMIANAGPHERKPLPGRVSTFTGGAPPPPSVINSMEDQGFAVTHSYGLTETFGPALVCTWKAKEWDRLPAPERARIKARQGVAHMGLQGGDVLDPSTMQPVARDGKTIGEIMVRGSTVMKGYFRDEDATRKAFEGGWFHTGDLGVVHPDGYIEVKDRSKDIIISGGENISSIEIESVLFKHPDILEAAVVARPDKQWGESPCAFVTLQESAKGVTTADTLVAYCRNNLPRYYVPKTIVFCDLPKTSTGKVQKFKLRERAKALNQSISKL